MFAINAINVVYYEKALEISIHVFFFFWLRFVLFFYTMIYGVKIRDEKTIY